MPVAFWLLFQFPKVQGLLHTQPAFRRGVGERGEQFGVPIEMMAGLVQRRLVEGRGDDDGAPVEAEGVAHGWSVYREARG